MTKIKSFLLPAALSLAAGCASFNSGDTFVHRNDLRSMQEERAVKPFSELRVVWKNFPYTNPTDSIGMGMINPPKPQAVPVPAGDSAWLKRHARKVFSETGLYDPDKGSGVLILTLTSFGRWTYGEIFKSFLVDTGYIFIVPASLRVNHHLAADYQLPGETSPDSNSDQPDQESFGPDSRPKGRGWSRVEEIGRNKTTFHALIFPLYPLFSPGAREHALLKKMLWKTAVDVYARRKREMTNLAAPEARPAATPAPAADTPAAATPAPPEEGTDD
jgi:hypothetical protein